MRHTIAAHMRISETHLRRIFKQELNTSPIKYINNLKLEKAKNMLCLSNYSVNEIAYIVGFNDEFYLIISVRLPMQSLKSSLINVFVFSADRFFNCSISAFFLTSASALRIAFTESSLFCQFNMASLLS